MNFETVICKLALVCAALGFSLMAIWLAVNVLFNYKRILAVITRKKTEESESN
jgi:hypothetical protein